MTQSQMLHKKRWIVVVTMLMMLVTGGALTFISNPPEDAPKVLVSVDRTMWHRLGFSRLTYLRALRAAGLRPIVIDFETEDSNSVAIARLLAGVDGLMLSGGGDIDPRRYGAKAKTALDVNKKRDSLEFALLEIAEQRGLPVLGICRGAQLINVHRGGTLGEFRSDQPRYKRHRRLRSGHAIQLEENSRLARVFGTTELASVVTFHGQYVDVPGKDVRVTGYAPDGTPEAIEVNTGSEFGMLGVQWHAEVVPWDRQQAKLFRVFASAAVSHQNRRK